MAISAELILGGFMMQWNFRFMQIAKEVSTWSKHPTTKVGCIIVDDDHNQLSGGFNGLPRGCDDSRIIDQSREQSSTVHAEANAVAAAARNGHSLLGSTAYVTQPPCSQCAALLIQAGVKQIFYTTADLSPKWMASFEEAKFTPHEAGVALTPLI
jgi:dCMP deaminase